MSPQNVTISLDKHYLKDVSIDGPGWHGRFKNQAVRIATSEIRNNTQVSQISQQDWLFFLFGWCFSPFSTDTMPANTMMGEDWEDEVLYARTCCVFTSGVRIIFRLTKPLAARVLVRSLCKKGTMYWICASRQTLIYQPLKQQGPSRLIIRVPQRCLT